MRRVVLGVQAEVEQRELDLAHRRKARMEAAGGDELAPLAGGQWLAGGVMHGHLLEDALMPGIVLEELARQLDRVPGDAVDAGEARVGDARQHVVQAVAELVEERHDVVVGQQGRLPIARRQEVADEVRDRGRGAARGRLAADAVVHPCAAALVRARVRVEVEAADRRAARLDLEVARVRVPGRDAAALHDTQAEQAFGDLEEGREHARQGKVRAQLFLRYRVAALLQPLGPEGDVAGLELRAREPFELGEFAQGGRACGARQLAQEGDDFRHALRHARGERVLGEVAEAEQARGLVAQAQDIPHDLRVVPLAGKRPLVGSARGPGLVEIAPQGLRFGVRDDGDIGRLVEREQPALAARVMGAAARLRDEDVVQPGELRGVGDVPGPGVGRIEHVLLELRLQRRQFEHRRLEAFLLPRVERDAREPELAQHVLDDAQLHGVELARFALRDRGVCTVKRFALRKVGMVFGQERQAGVVGLAQRRGVRDGVQVADRRPGAGEAMLQVLERLHEPREARRLVGGEPRDARAAFLEERADRRLDVLGADLIEAGQQLVGQQGVRHRAIVAVCRMRNA